MKNGILLFGLVLGFWVMGSGVVWGQTSYTSTSAIGAWNTSRWNNSADGPTYSSTYTANNPVSFTSGTYSIAGMGATINVGNVTVASGVTVNFTSPSSTFATNGAVRTINVGSGGTFNTIDQSFSTAVGTGFIKNGDGTWICANGNAYPGGFTMNAGTFIIGGVNAMGNGGALNINGGTLAAASNRNITSRYTGINIGGNFTFGNSTNTSNITFADNVALGGATRTITIGATGTYTFSGVVSNGGLTIGSTAAGTITLTGANTYTGLTTINGGTLNLNRSGGGTLPNTNNVTVEGGTLQISTNQTLNNLTVASGATVTVSSGATLTINGTLDCGSTAVISGAGAFTLASGATLKTANASGVSGSITVSGTKTYNNGANYEFQGAATGTFNSTSNNVTINNASGVTLTNALTVNGTLTLTSGKLTLGSSTLTIGNSGSISGGSSSNYVATTGSGILKKNSIGGTPFTFPIGDATYYTPVTLTNAGTSDNFSVLFNQSYPSCISSAAQQNGSVVGQWDIAEDVAGGSNCTISINVGGLPAGGGFELLKGAIAHCNGSVIDRVSGSVSGTVITGTGFTSFSPFGAGNEAALPIELAYFHARPHQKTTLLTWRTLSELKNDFFSVERSTDGNRYAEIGTVPGKGTSVAVNDYHFTDPSPAPGLNYYRLRQVDYDGQSSYSPVVSVKFEQAGKGVAIYPTITTNEVWITLPEENQTPGEVHLFDQNGRLLNIWQVEPGQASLSIPAGHLPGGVYFLKIQTGRTVETGRFFRG